MTYVCMECGNSVEYEYLVQHKLKCTKCKEKRSNIWVKTNAGSPRDVQVK